MYRSMLIILFAALALSACCKAQPSPTTAQPAPRLSEQEIRDEVAAVLKANPGLVMDVIAERKMDVATLVEEGFIARREQARVDQTARELAAPRQPEIDESRPMIGDKDAEITVVEYTDFQCPYCARGAKTVKALVERHPGKVRVFFKHVPLHDQSLKLALYFEALARQDQAKAWAFHDLAFANMQALGEGDEAFFNELVAQVDPDMDQLAEDLQSEEVQAQVEADLAEAREFGFSGTPVFLVNGVSIVGAYPIEEFERVMALVENQPGQDEKAPAKSETKENGEDCETCLAQ